jgi:fructan beta-fructosidase
LQEPIALDKYQTLALEQKDLPLDNAKVDFRGESYRLLAEIEINQATTLGLNLLKTGEEQSVLTYNVGKGELSFDRTKSGNVSFSDRFASIESIKVSPKNGILKLQLLVDKSVVEIFANDGQQVMTDLVFPTKHDGELSFFGDGKSRLKSLKIWNVNPEITKK